MQSRMMSLAEAVTNVSVGYLVAIITQMVVFPWFGLSAPLSAHLAVGAVFTVVSIARSYVLRRIFNRIGLHAPEQ